MNLNGVKNSILIVQKENLLIFFKKFYSTLPDENAIETLNYFSRFYSDDLIVIVKTWSI